MSPERKIIKQSVNTISKRDHSCQIDNSSQMACNRAEERKSLLVVNIAEMANRVGQRKRIHVMTTTIWYKGFFIIFIVVVLVLSQEIQISKAKIEKK